MSNDKTEIEKAWDLLPHGKIIRTCKTFVRDVRNCFDICDIKYEEEDISSFSGSLPDYTWVQQEFYNAILGTPEGRRDLQLKVPTDINFQSTIIKPPNWEIILRCMEDKILHMDLIHSLYAPKGSIADKIKWILCHREIGEKNRQHIQTRDIEEILKISIDSNQPLRIVLPAFPFKDQNPFRTEARPSHVDMGEIIMLAKLYTLTKCLIEVLPSIGVEFIITCDGVIYSDIFGVKTDEAIAYREQIRSYRNLLNLQQLIHILDINDLIRRLDEFESVRDVIKKHLIAGINSDSKMKERFDVLVRGIKFNLNIRPYVDKFGLETLAKSIDDTISGKQLLDSEQDLRREIIQHAKEASLKYVSLHLAMKYCNMFQRLFPNSLRATIHPKPGQIGIAKNGKVLPWNGVPLVSNPQEEELWKNIQVLEISRILNQAHTQTLRKVYLEGDSDPFYYQIF